MFRLKKITKIKNINNIFYIFIILEINIIYFSFYISIFRFFVEKSIYKYIS
jgi:hypothetical protein